MNSQRTNKPRVVLISYDFGEYCIRLASALVEEASVCLILPEQLAAPYRHLLHPAVDFHPFHKPRLRQPYQQLRVLRWIWQQIQQVQPDVIHLQNGHLWFNTLLWPRLHRYPRVLTVHDARPHPGDRGAANTPQWVMQAGFRAADQLIAHNGPVKQILLEDSALSSKQIAVIPHLACGDTNQIQPTNNEEDSILFFGRIWPYKGLEYLIRAEPLISAQHATTKIVIAGEGEDFTPYRQLMRNPERFEVHNRFIPDEQIPHFFQQAGLVVLPYIEASQSGVIATAYSFGKPVVASAVGGLCEQVDHGQTGLLVPPRDEQQLAAAVLTLLQDPQLRQRLGRNGQHKVEREWSAATVARQTAQVYQQAIATYG